MESFGLLIIFWYGILHAFGPDHLTAIADFSIGKSMKKTFAITIAFAVGHGVMLFVFAKVLDHYTLPEYITDYGDVISASVILLMGLYILSMVFMDRIQLKRHIHDGQEHIHIWFGKKHKHDNAAAASAFTMGALMGIGGVRGMLVTLGLLEGQRVEWFMVLMFVLGVSVVFLTLGIAILYINQNLLNNLESVKKVFASVGIISVVVGSNMLFTGHSHAVMIEPDINGIENHPHPHAAQKAFSDAEGLVASKAQSEMTYKQMMQRMGEAYSMMQRGLILQNKELIKTGTWMIDDHPAPKEKPWLIMQQADQNDFKKTLIAYNDLLHGSAFTINEALKNDDWYEINKQVFDLSNHCISCHQTWMHKVTK